MLFALFPSIPRRRGPGVDGRVAGRRRRGRDRVRLHRRARIRIRCAVVVPPDTVLHSSTAFCAAVTRRLKLGTGITLFPRQPLAVAKRAASITLGGRILGIGVGYVPLEQRCSGSTSVPQPPHRRASTRSAMDAAVTRADGELSRSRHQRIPRPVTAATHPRRRHQRGGSGAGRTRERMDRRRRNPRRRARRADRDRHGTRALRPARGARRDRDHRHAERGARP